MGPKMTHFGGPRTPGRGLGGPWTGLGQAQPILAGPNVRTVVYWASTDQYWPVGARDGSQGSQDPWEGSWDPQNGSFLDPFWAPREPGGWEIPADLGHFRPKTPPGRRPKRGPKRGPGRGPGTPGPGVPGPLGPVKTVESRGPGVLGPLPGVLGGPGTPSGPYWPLLASTGPIYTMRNRRPSQYWLGLAQTCPGASQTPPRGPGTHPGPSRAPTGQYWSVLAQYTR